MAVMNGFLPYQERVSYLLFHWVGHKPHQLAGMVGTCASDGVLRHCKTVICVFRWGHETRRWRDSIYKVFATL
jgi:hypothetical protein